MRAARSARASTVTAPLVAVPTVALRLRAVRAQATCWPVSAPEVVYAAFVAPAIGRPPRSH